MTVMLGKVIYCNFCWRSFGEHDPWFPDVKDLECQGCINAVNELKPVPKSAKTVSRVVEKPTKAATKAPPKESGPRVSETVKAAAGVGEKKLSKQFKETMGSLFDIGE